MNREALWYTIVYMAKILAAMAVGVAYVAGLEYFLTNAQAAVVFVASVILLVGGWMYKMKADELRAIEDFTKRVKGEE